MVSLRGVSRRYTRPVSIQTDDGETRVAGRLRLLHSDFGITPFSVFGGALSVRDTVDVDFLIVAGNLGRSM
ncbi:MAG: YceI family protein [Sedimenticolaceae bacterium]